MTIRNQISFNQYRRLLFRLIYRKPIMKVIIGVGVLMLTWIAGFYLHLLPIPEPEIFQFIALGLISVFQPAGIYWTVKRSYDSSSHLGVPLEMDITPAILKMKADS